MTTKSFRTIAGVALAILGSVSAAAIEIATKTQDFFKIDFKVLLDPTKFPFASYGPVALYLDSRLDVTHHLRRDAHDAKAGYHRQRHGWTFQVQKIIGDMSRAYHSHLHTHQAA